jgi:hypothetical protein
MSSSNSDPESSSSSSSESDSSSAVETEKKDGDDDDDEDMKMPQPTPSKQPRPFPVRKGSQVFPSNKTYKVFDSRKRHYRYLHRVGLEKKKQARTKRRKLREILTRTGAEFDLKQYPTLQSSSSEDSDYQEENSDWERETVDVQAMAHDSWWAKETLYGIMPVTEISKLVGWATHQTHDGTRSDKGIGNLVAAAASIACEGTPGNAAGASESTTQRQIPSPLLGLPNTPLPPSYLQYLSEVARSYVEEPHQRDKWMPRAFLTTADSLDAKPVSKRRHRKEWQQWDYDSEDETYQRLKTSHDNNHVTLHVPCPAKKEKPENKAGTKSNNGRTHLYESMDTSALVALGMVWEDAITASLLPLARQHVARCRRLEQQKLSELRSTNDMSNRSEEEARMDPFQEWTLPPEQAIWRLAQEGVNSELPSSLPPTRVSNQCFDRTSSVNEMLVNRFGTEDQREQRAVDNWCRSRNLDPTFVDNNMDLYGVVLSHAPTTPLVTEESLQERQERYDMLYERRSKANIVKKKRAAGGEKNRSTLPGKNKDDDLSEEEGQNERVAEVTNKAHSEIVTVAV